MPSTELALYIHWPFCLAKCPYCDFNSHVREHIPQAHFATALRTELAWEAARLNADGPRTLTSIFFGGGTPSLMDPATAADLIADATSLFTPAANVEITLEANPTSVELGKLAAFAQAGVNRLSLGIQSLDNDALRFLGRQHSAAQAIAALEIARALFPRLSFDLIYARPNQSIPAWQAELRQALSLAADHLSLYQLTIEPDTPFESQYRSGRLSLPEPEHAAALYDATTEAAARFNLHPYEVSNYAAGGGESRHNLAYWLYNDYAGIGPGAHGRVTRGAAIHATRRHRAPEPWAALVDRQSHGTTDDAPVPPRDRAREMLLMGLRLQTGLSATRFVARTGLRLIDSLDRDTVNAAIEADYLTWDGETLTIRPEGRIRLNALLARLIQ